MPQENETGLAWETVQLQYIREWQDGHAPTLQEFVRRYPQWSDELTDFVLNWLPMQNAANLADATVSPTTTALIAQAVQQTTTAPRTLTEARQQLGWSPGRFARELNLPERIGVQLMRGLRGWPPQLEQKLAHLLGRSQEQIRAILQATAPTPAVQWKAKGQPKRANTTLPTWEEALAECARRGELTTEQQQEWMHGGE
jgi:hypothetical protein